MSTDQEFDGQVRAYLGEGPRQLSVAQRDAIALATEDVAQQRGILPSLWPSRRLVQVTVALAVAVAIALAAALIVPRLDLPRIGGPNPAMLLWTADGRADPYPAPLRTEPLQVPPDLAGPYTDPIGDVEAGAPAYADLVSVQYGVSGCWWPGSVCIRYETAGAISRPLVHPLVEWIAYGVVFDNDGDGRPDMRFGIDNMPEDSLRAWATDLDAGTTTVVGPRVYPDHGPLWEVDYPFTKPGADPDPLVNGRRAYVFLHPDLTTPDGRFYVWSAVIRDGQIVAMDFMPDVGWLDARPDDAE